MYTPYAFSPNSRVEHYIHVKLSVLRQGSRNFVQPTWQACTAGNMSCCLLSELSAQADEFLHNT